MSRETNAMRFREGGEIGGNPFAPGPPIDAAMAAALQEASAVPAENPFTINPVGSAPVPRTSLLSGFAAAVSGLLGKRGAPAPAPAPPAAAQVPLPVVAHIVAAPNARNAGNSGNLRNAARNAGNAARNAGNAGNVRNAAPNAGVSWWRSALQALAPVERVQMLYGYVTKKVDYNVVDFVGGLMRSGVRPEDILKLIEYRRSESLASINVQVALNDEYSGKQLMAAIVDFAIVLEYYKKIYAAYSNNRKASGIPSAVLNNAIELLFEKLTIMLHAYTIHENAKAQTGISLAPNLRSASLAVNYAGTEQAYFGERALSVDIPGILNDALTLIKRPSEKLTAILNLLGKEGDINGNSLSIEGFSANIVENLKRTNANAQLEPLRGRNGLIDTLKKVERLPRVGGAGIAGISQILSNEVGRGVEILSGTAANQQRSLDELSIVGEPGNVAIMANVEGTQQYTNNTYTPPSLANAGAAQNVAAHNAAEAARNAAARNAAARSAAARNAAARSAAAASLAALSKKRNRNGNLIPNPKPPQTGSGKSRKSRKSRKSKARKNTRKMRKN